MEGLMSLEREVRGGIPAEIRADADGIKVSGYAAVFNQEVDIGGMFREVIEPGAFKRAAKRDDVVFLINHDGLPLARTRSGTLKLTEDDHGLRIDAELDPDDPDVRAIVPKMKRGDLDKMSFAFRSEMEIWDETTEPPTRTIMEARLYDVSIVTTPAYDGTSIALRSLDASQKETAKRNAEAAQRRIAESKRKAEAEQKFRKLSPG
jgi:HK97 family phage prohead protease